MTEPKICIKCVMPEAKPEIFLDEHGVCNICVQHAKDKTSAEAEKGLETDFTKILAQHRGKHEYDCLVMCSGGKDSTWQVVKCLEYGLNPLCVTWKTPARTEIGTRNLANLVSLGVDHIDYQINPEVEKRFMYDAFVRHGSTAIPMHMALFSIPLSIAVKFRIPLVIWGENSAFEYGGTEEEQTGFRLDGQWLKKFGVTHGTTAKDWVSAELSAKSLTPYFGPSDVELGEAGVLAAFLGYYFPWDPQVSLAVATAHGFKADSAGPRTGYYNYADIDDDFISIHHWMKWYKFGFTRLFDNLSLEIRNGRMTRERAVELIAGSGDQTPRGDIDKLCAYIGITTERFFEIAETFRSPSVWQKRDEKWMIDGFIVKDWTW